MAEVIEPCSTVPEETGKSPKRVVDTSEEPAKKRMRLDQDMRNEAVNEENSLYTLRVKRHSETAKLPRRGSKYAAGYDVYSSVDIKILAQGKALVPTDISIQIPLGFYGRIAPRSGLALKHHLDVGAGVIDSDYRGKLGILIFNFSQEDYDVKTGDRIAQLLLEKIITPEVEEVAELESTDRGEGGFGSTGSSDKDSKVSEK